MVRWQGIRLVVFDMDGTLYDQPPLRRRMLLALFCHALTHPRSVADIRAVADFRRRREDLALRDGESVRDQQFAATARACGLPEQRLRDLVEYWIMQRPLRYLSRYKAKGIDGFLAALRRQKIVPAVFSDYPAEMKIEALKLDVEHCVSATDPAIDRLKPHPAGLLALLERTGVAAKECVFIGDRADRDGLCAERAGTHFLWRTTRRARSNSFRHYDELTASLMSAGPTNE